MDYKTILIAESASKRTITLNRPERRNAMTPEMQMELISALEDAASSSCRVLVLAGAGEAFCSGLDLSALQAMQDKSAAEHRADAERIARLFLTLYELPMPTIAAVDGAAIAGGAGLAILCDFTLATPAAKFGFTEVRIGFVPALVSAFLALQIADKRSRDLLLTGRLFDAEEAYRLGLVSEIVRAGTIGAAGTGTGRCADRKQSSIAQSDQVAPCAAEQSVARRGGGSSARGQRVISGDRGFPRRDRRVS